MANRKLKAELSALMRSRIPLTEQELAAASAADLLMMAYAALEGIRETGDNRGRFVEMIQYTVGLKPGDSWCMAAAQTAVRFVELYKGIISSLPVGGHCLTVLKNSPPTNQVQKTDKPRPGDLIVYQYGDTSNGHVEGIVSIYQEKFAFTMGGNTSSGPGVNSNGDGVFYRMRSLRVPGGDMRIAGFVRPFPDMAAMSPVADE